MKKKTIRIEKKRSQTSPETSERERRKRNGSEKSKGEAPDVQEGDRGQPRLEGPVINRQQ